MDRHDLYELCVQNPAVLAGFLRRLHGGNPTRLAEDFCGTAALSREWVRPTGPPRKRMVGDVDAPSACAEGSFMNIGDPVHHVWATCLDADPDVIAQAVKRATADAAIDLVRMEFLECDALLAPLPRVPKDGVDIIFVGNFSIGEIHERSGLVEYLRRARARLRHGGIIVCDTYGGESAWRTGVLRRVHQAPIEVHSGLSRSSTTRIHYTWEQRSANPFTARVVNALHFRVEENGEIVQEFTDAFVYHWRVWSVPELRDAMQEAGFAVTEFHTQMQASCEKDENPVAQQRHFAACVVGRT